MNEQQKVDRRKLPRQTSIPMAARIVACVNFLAGIPSDKLDGTMLERLLAVERERDEAIAVLQSLYALVKGESPSLLENDHHDDLVRDVLAKYITP